MDEDKLTNLAKQALAESKRNDCEIVKARAGASDSWQIDLMDVMLKREPFTISVSVEAQASDEEIKESVRRAVAEHYSVESN